MGGRAGPLRGRVVARSASSAAHRAPLAGVSGAVFLGYAAVVALTAATTDFTVRDVATSAGFACAVLLSVEVSLRRAWPRSRASRISRDFLGVWTIPVMLLLPPFYGAV